MSRFVCVAVWFGDAAIAAELSLRARQDRSFLVKIKEHVLDVATSDVNQLNRLICVGDLGLEAFLLLNFKFALPPQFDANAVRRALVDFITLLLKAGVGFSIPTTFQPFSLLTAIVGVLIQDNGLGGKDSKDGLGVFSDWLQEELWDVVEEVQRTAASIAAEFGTVEGGGLGTDRLVSLTDQCQRLDVSDPDWDNLSLFTLAIDDAALTTTGVKRKASLNASERRKIRRLEALERIVDFLGPEAVIIYSQGFSTISSVIPAFCKRGDIIIADRGVNFAIQRGVRWYDHTDLKSLEDVLEIVEKEKKEAPGAAHASDGAMTDLPKLIELKYRKKYRLILDESISFGTVASVPARKMLLTTRRHIFLSSCNRNSSPRSKSTASFVFPASMPALLAVSTSEETEILRSSLSILIKLHQDIRVAHMMLDDLECISIPSRPASPIIHMHICARPGAAELHFCARPGAAALHFCGKWDWDVDAEDRMLQDEALRRDLMTTREAAAEA
ncbi:hypothetical protein DFH09DRAFT_1363576 [Mycena vulgaris]|nr:hypothetical protein DFH09DRAFT_1363576 [Mycena vulgaris]